MSQRIGDKLLKHAQPYQGVTSRSDIHPWTSASLPIEIHDNKTVNFPKKNPILQARAITLYQLELPRNAITHLCQGL